MKHKLTTIRPLNNDIIKILISFILLVVGGVIYIGWRSGDLVVFQLMRNSNLSGFLNCIQDFCVSIPLYDWVKYSLPDGLWLFSYMFLIETIWDNQRSISYFFFLWCLPVIAIVSEFLQYVGIVPGTFDILDLVCYFLSIAFFYLLKMF